MGGVYPYSLFHDILRGREREGEGERKGKGKGKREREREREREEKTVYGFVITESFSYLCMRDRYDRQTGQALSPLHIKTD